MRPAATLLGRSKWLTVVRELARNAGARRRARRGPLTTESGTQSRGVDVEAAAAYASSTFETTIVRLGGLAAPDLAGARVLEVGPGDHLGFALRLLAAGAAEVTCIDRFHVAHDPERQAAIYRAIAGSLTPAEAAALGDLELTADGLRRSGRIRFLPGVAVEDAPEALEPARFDLVTSVAVLQHVQDPDAALEALDRLLVPGGRMLHQIDLSDVGLFTGRGWPPLTFLTVPEWAYVRMTSHVGAANRRLVDFYRTKLAQLGYDAELLVTHVVGDERPLASPVGQLVRGTHFDESHVAHVDAVRARIRPAFRGLAIEDLLTAGVFVRARKPYG